MKIKNINFINNFRMRTNSDGTGELTHQLGVLCINETVVDQMVSLNESNTIEQAAEKMASIYDESIDIMKSDLLNTISKLGDLGIKHKHITL